jgi:hypothetical protein
MILLPESKSSKQGLCGVSITSTDDAFIGAQYRLFPDAAIPFHLSLPEMPHSILRIELLSVSMTSTDDAPRGAQ